LQHYRYSLYKKALVIGNKGCNSNADKLKLHELKLLPRSLAESPARGGRGDHAPSLVPRKGNEGTREGAMGRGNKRNYKNSRFL
jgi:hypothetical protein